MKLNKNIVIIVSNRMAIRSTEVGTPLRAASSHRNETCLVSGSPIILGLNTSSERVAHLCVFYNSDFILYSSLSSFYIPCLVMILLYYRIFRGTLTACVGIYIH